MLAIQRPDWRGSFIHELTEDGLYFKPENSLDELLRRGRSYDISSSAKLTEMLVKEGLGQASVRRRIGSFQSRFFHVPAAVLESFDVTITDGESVDAEL